MAQNYERPQPPAGTEIRSLLPQHGRGETLTPDTIVRAINRGNEPIIDKFDGIDYEIPPGWYEAPYGAVRHFQQRAVVPGSRNPEQKKQQSYIAIPNVDPADRCVPFTEAQCAQFKGIPEAIDRKNRISPDDRDHQIVDLGELAPGLAMGEAFGSGRRPQIDLSQQATPGAAAAAETVLQPPAENEALREIAADSAAVEGIEASEAAARQSRRRGGRTPVTENEG